MSQIATQIKPSVLGFVGLRLARRTDCLGKASVGLMEGLGRVFEDSHARPEWGLQFVQNARAQTPRVRANRRIPYYSSLMGVCQVARTRGIETRSQRLGFVAILSHQPRQQAPGIKYTRTQQTARTGMKQPPEPVGKTPNPRPTPGLNSSTNRELPLAKTNTIVNAWPLTPLATTLSATGSLAASKPGSTYATHLLIGPFLSP